VKELFKKFSMNLLRFIPFTMLVITISLLSGLRNNLPSFLVALSFVFLGVFMFDLGAKEFSSKVASELSKTIVIKKNLVLLIMVAFLLGLVIAVFEPNMWVMSHFLNNFIQEWVFVLSVSIGIGIALTIALLRVVFRVSIKSVFIVFYISLLIIALITSIRNPTMVLLAFDAGGVIPGLILIPFVIGFSVGITKVRSDKTAISDAFGMVGIVAIGPMLSLLVLGLFYQVENIERTPLSVVEYLVYYLILMAIVFIPMMLAYLLINYKSLKQNKQHFIKRLIAGIYTYVGVVLVLTGINGGIIDFAELLGEKISLTWMPLLMVGLGLSIVLIEPSIRILRHHIIDITAGAINKRFLYISIIISLLLALLFISMRIIFNISIWWIIIPGYVMAIVLSLFSKDLFLSIAFDTAGAISGLLSVGFILPFLMGITPMENAIGNIIIIQLMPLIIIQLLALIMKKRSYSATDVGVDDIIDI